MGLADFKLAFGKAPAKRDTRNLDLETVFLPGGDPLPAEYDFDDEHPGIPTPMFGNNNAKNCVIAGRAHQTLRFEMAEQNVLIHITNEDVEREYRKEADAENNEIKLLDSLNLWWKRGWEAAGQHFKIKGYGEIKDRTNREAIKRAIYVNMGVGLGFLLPDSALEQFKAGQPWEVTRDLPGNTHYVYVSGYTTLGPVCVTWGRKQPMSWEFVTAYSDEAYAIFDALDTPRMKRNFNEKKFDEFLKTCPSVSGHPGQIRR
jgi:hypothetical protein